MKPLAIIVVLVFCSTSNAAGSIEPLGLLLEAPTAVKLIAEYLGVIESLDSKIDRLLDADFKTAVSLFEQAKENPKKAARLIHDARVCFTRAAALEADSMDESRRHRRALALLGLWACCEADSDAPNANLALKKITEIPSDPSVVMQVKFHAQNQVSDILLDQVTFFEGSIRAWRRKPPTTNEWRKFDKAYDSLLTIQHAVKTKLEPK